MAVKESASPIEDIRLDYRADPPLDATELSSHIIVGGVRHVCGLVLEISWHQHVLCILYVLPQLKDGILDFQPIFSRRLLEAGEVD